MVSLSVDGLVSGLDTTSLVSQLVAAEALPQTRLKAQMSAAQKAADAYRAVNTKVDAVRAAAEALTADGLAAARTAKSTAASVTASATSTAVPGSRISFTVGSLASTASYLSTATWATTGTDVRKPIGPDATTPGPSPWPLTITRPDGTPTPIDPPDQDATLAETIAYINDREDLGVRATAVNTGNGYRLQLTSTTPGAKGYFDVQSAAGDLFTVVSPAKDATLDVGGVAVTSPTNTFADLMTGVAITVTEESDTSVVVEVGEDLKTVATKVKTLVDAVNAALTSIATNTDSGTSSTAVLKGDFALRQLASRLLTKVSDAVPGAVPSASTPGTYTAGSPAALGVQLTRDGKVTFDEATFLKSMQSDPEAVHRLLGGAPASDGAPAVEGLAQRLATTAKDATKSTTGTLTLLAQGREALVKDYQSRIADWDLRLAARKEALTRQFSAMETALSSLKNQSSWLAGQLGSLSG
ncbi:flagellar filament capping protein FliD [Geodermatophilus obscurus]|uniref:Flagellar hook-associated protein 2 n=1 Tax=Geodermatophilus obscurus (strain ATCC 25078 / DSM 43160 / JCM 3152 / CCUG 61914 / KCC A-0152 / KCTC 9177 / NBRC 13315 / NRRL B-3577 / G-20) TaxID=526225 RepID=D2S9N2_GEOOG|nr:flagellar filament capping protein FliD [Geodermatophilus obscurus]ADB73745.1 flagellar hook-associated 2 domain protein [Geodermatophilus obscurus DSM 43160]